MAVSVARIAAEPPSRGRLALSGIIDTAPILPGIVPFGMIYGAAAVALGMSPGMAQGMSLALFAGASQVAAVGLLAHDAAWFTVLVAVIVVNSRYLMYGAALAQVIPGMRGPQGALASYLLTDQGFAVTVAQARAGRPRSELVPYYLGSSVVLWSTWQLGTACGIVLGSVVPPSWQLEFSIPLMFLALLVPVLKDRPSWLAAAGAGAGALVGRGLPHNLGLIVGVLGGVALGLAAENRWAPRKEKP